MLWRAVHANVGNKVAAFIDHRNVYRLSDFTGPEFGSFNDSACFPQRDH